MRRRRSTNLHYKITPVTRVVRATSTRRLCGGGGVYGPVSTRPARPLDSLLSFPRRRSARFRGGAPRRIKRDVRAGVKRRIMYDSILPPAPYLTGSTCKVYFLLPKRLYEPNSESSLKINLKISARLVLFTEHLLFSGLHVIIIFLLHSADV